MQTFEYRLNVYREVAKKEGYILLTSTPFNTKKDVIQMTCPNRHLYETRWAWFDTLKRRCNKCRYDKQRNQTDDIINLVEYYKYKVDVSNYKDQHSLIKFTCPNGHLYEARYSGFKAGKRCPKCRGERDYWDREDIENLLFIENYKYVSHNTARDITLICPNNHIHITSMYKWQIGGRCGKCHAEKTFYNIDDLKLPNNLKIIEVINNQVKVQCEHGHINQKNIGYFVGRPRCPTCFLTPMHDYEEIKKEFEKYKYVLKSDKYFGNKKYLSVACPDGHEYTTKYNTFQQGNRCPVCASQSSRPEFEIIELLSQHKIKTIHRHRDFGFEIDVYIPELKLGIEYCGLYWHSNEYKRPIYHQKKWRDCKSLGIRLITIFEDEWIHKRSIVESRVLNAIGKSKKIGARNFKIDPVPSNIASQFFEENHIQGSSGSIFTIGLYYNNILYSALSIGKPSRKHVTSGYEIKRFATIKGYNVQGGLSRLLKEALKHIENEELISFCDLRYGTGIGYESVGFELLKISRPTPWVVNIKEIKRKSIFSEYKSEEKAKYKIYDCGHAKYIYKIHT